VGFLRGGGLANLDSVNLRGIWIVFIALIIQILIFPLFSEHAIVTVGTSYLHLFSYLLLAVFVVINIKVWELSLMGVGMLLNFLVIALNHGYMPTSVTSLQGAGQQAIADCLLNSGTYGNVIKMTSSTVLNFFGDWLYLPSFFPMSSAFSLGDLLISVGLIAFFGLEMVEDSKT